MYEDLIILYELDNLLIGIIELIINNVSFLAAFLSKLSPRIKACDEACDTSVTSCKWCPSGHQKRSPDGAPLIGLRHYDEYNTRKLMELSLSCSWEVRCLSV